MKKVLAAFDKYLAKEGLTFEAVIIGGAALIVMDVVDRQTKDVDCLDPVINDKIKKLSQEFAKDHPELKLMQEWLNNGPQTLKRDLPEDWITRIHPIYKGRALTLSTLGRIDLLRSKLFAYCDRQTDFDDCVALAPNEEELRTCYPWVVARDQNPLWPEHVLTSFKDLAEKGLGYEFKP